MKSLDRFKEFVYEDDVLIEMAENVEDEVLRRVLEEAGKAQR